MPQTEIKFASRVVYSRLKHVVNTTGIQIQTIGYDNTVNLTAITSKGLPAVGHLSLPKEDLTAFIDALIKIRDANINNS